MPVRIGGPTGEFLPDIQDRDNPGITVAENVIPHISGFTQARSLAPTQLALDDRCLGAYITRDYDGNLHNYAGDATTLYEASGGAYGDVSKAGGYVVTEPRHWEFVKINNDMLAANGVDPLQIQKNFFGNFDDVVPTSDPDGVFPDTPAPNAQYLAEVAGFVVTGWQPGAQNKLQWSGLRAPDVWATGWQQAGEQILQAGGKITGIAGGEYGVVFTENSIYRMNYTGDPTIIFNIPEVAPGRGTTAPGSITQFGEQIFFIDSDGFYRFDGSVARPIGSNKLNHWFVDDYDTNYDYRVRSAIDTQNALVYWAYPSKTAANGQPDKIIVYDIVTGKFAGPIRVQVEELLYAATDTAVLLDEFLADDPRFSSWTALPDGTPDYDANQLDMDSGPAASFDVDNDQFKGGGITILSAFDTNHTLSQFSGPPLTAKVESAEINLVQGGKALVTGFRALVEGDSPNTTVQVGFRDKTSGPVQWTSPITPNEITELADVLIDARYHRFRINVSGEFEVIFGGEPEYEKSGFR